MFGAGEAETLQREVRNIGDLMWTAAVVDMKFPVGAVDKQAAPIAVAISNLRFGDLVRGPDIVPAFFSTEVLGVEFRNVHVEQDIDGPYDFGEPQCGEGVQDSVEDFARGSPGIERAVTGST